MLAKVASKRCSTSDSTESGGPQPPPCAGRNPSLRSVASALAPHTRWVFYWPPLPHSRAGAGGDCLQASAAGGFGLPTPAEWTHSVSCWQVFTLILPRCSLRPAGSLGPAAPTGWLRHSAVLVSSRRTADPMPLGTPAD